MKLGLSRPDAMPTAWLEEALAFAIANGWRPPPDEEPVELASERPTLPAPAMEAA